MAPKNESEIETETLEKKTKGFFNEQMIKILGVCYMVGAPWFVWATLEIFSLRSQVIVLQEKQNIIQEIKEDIRTIKKDLETLKIQVTRLERGNP